MKRQRAIAANLPTTCPACGGNAVPLWWDFLDSYDCDNPQCHAIFSGRD